MFPAVAIYKRLSLLLVLYKSCPWFTSYFDSSYFTEPQTALLKPIIRII